MSGQTFTGASFIVELTKSVAHAFDKVELRSKARLQRWMEKLAQFGMDSVLPDILKREDRIRAQGYEVTIYAMREGTIRLYGGIVPQKEGPPIFLMTEIETKKRGAGKADQQRLGRAAQHLVQRIQASSTGGQR